MIRLAETPQQRRDKTRWHKLSPETRKRHTEKAVAIRRRQRNEQRDDSCRAGKERGARIDLGMNLLSMHALPGVGYDFDEIAAWWGCTDAFVHLVFQGALRKVRDLLQFNDREMLREFRAEYFERRSPAQKARPE